MSGSTVLVADAFGNTLFSATTSGSIDWKAIFTPPVDENGDFKVRWETENEEEKRSPIPADANNVTCSDDSGPCEVLIDGLTSVIDFAIGPDGRLYVVEFDESSYFASFIEGLPLGGTISS